MNSCFIGLVFSGCKVTKNPQDSAICFVSWTFSHVSFFIISLSSRLHMHGNMGLSTISTTQKLLYFRGFVVGFTQRNVGIHQDMQFNSIMITDATSTQGMRHIHAINRTSQSEYLLLHLVGQRLFQ